MDKNIAAFLREDTRTIRVCFQTSPDDNSRNAMQNQHKLYTYIATFPVEVGNLVVVPAAGLIKIAEVVEVDPDLQLEPNSDIKYQWAIDTVDFKAFEASMQRNTAIEDALTKSYRTNMRKSFADQLLATLDDASRTSLTALIKG